MALFSRQRLRQTKYELVCRRSDMYVITDLATEDLSTIGTERRAAQSVPTLHVTPLGVIPPPVPFRGSSDISVFHRWVVRGLPARILAQQVLPHPAYSFGRLYMTNRSDDTLKTENAIILGEDLQTSEPVVLSPSARQYSLYTIGTPGVGKSALMESIARQDMENGDGLCFLDPHGDSVQRLLRLAPDHRQDDIIFWDPKDLVHPFKLNPFYCPDVTNLVAVDRKVENFISALSSLQEFVQAFANAPRMVDLLRHLAFACVLNPGATLLSTVKFLTDETYRQTFYPALHRYDRLDILTYWQQFDRMTRYRQEEIILSSLNKLRRLATTNITRLIFNRSQPTLDFRTLIDQRKILLVDLASLGAGNGELLGALIVFDLMQAAFSGGDTAAILRPTFHLFADEFERFMNTSFPQIIDEGRKFKLHCVLAHQHRGQLEGASRGSTLNIKNKVIFQVNSEDAKELSWEFDTTPPPGEPKLEIVTEPVYESTYEPEWAPPEAKAEYEYLLGQYSSMMLRYFLLRRAFAVETVEWSDIHLLFDERQQQGEIDSLRYKYTTDDYFVKDFLTRLRKDQLFYAELLSPFPQSPVVMQYIDTHLPHPTMGSLPLPPGLPSYLEVVLGQLLTPEVQRQRCQGYWTGGDDLLMAMGFAFKARCRGTWFPEWQQSISLLKAKQYWYETIRYDHTRPGCPAYLQPPTMEEFETAVSAFLTEFQNKLAPLKQKAPFRCNVRYEDGTFQKVKPKFFPEMLAWLYTEGQALEKRKEVLHAQLESLRKNHCKLVEKKRYLGYDLPVKQPKDALDPAGHSGAWVNTERLQPYRRVEGPRKPHSDKAAEIANALTFLSRFTARCKIVDERGKPAEYTIRTLKPPDIPNAAEAKAARIIDQSRCRYGRARLDGLSLNDERATDTPEHDILTERNPAHDDTNRSLPGEKAPSSQDRADEDDPWR